MVVMFRHNPCCVLVVLERVFICVVLQRSLLQCPQTPRCLFCTLGDSCKCVLHLHSQMSMSDLPLKGVLEQQHTVQWFLHWHFEHLDPNAGHQWEGLHMSEIFLLLRYLCGWLSYWWWSVSNSTCHMHLSFSWWLLFILVLTVGMVLVSVAILDSWDLQYYAKPSCELAFV